MVLRPRFTRVGYLSVFITVLAAFLITTLPTVIAQTWSLPAPWSAQDIGSPSTPGSATFDQGTFTIHAAGNGLGNRSDQFTFIYQQVTGDVDIAARVDSLTAASSSSKSGLMIRNSLAPNASYGYAFVSASNGVDFQRRPDDGANSFLTNGPSTNAPYWVRIAKKGTTVTGYSSADGKNWATITSRTITLGSTVYVGIATTSSSSSAATDASVSQVSIAGLSLPASQHAIDIGSPSIQGSTSFSQGVYQIHAGGADIWGTSDQFHFVYQPLSGDGEVVAHVRSLSNSDAWAKTGVMIRETLTAGSRHASALLTVGNGYAFQRRIDPGGVSVHTAGTAGTAPGWVRVVRSGSQFQAYQSTDGSTWRLIGSDTIPMSTTAYVGIATTSHNTSVATDAVVDNFSVTAGGATSNQPPSVAITSPANGTTFTAGTTLVVNAAANDADGTVSRVDFFAGSTQIGSDTTAPYSANWANVAAGTYSLTAKAVDNDGATTTSATISVRADTAANQPPTVSLTAPANGATYTAPATLSLTATASDSDGTIAKVQFYNGTTLLNTDTTAPYAYTWGSVAAGTYTVKAVAYDNSGASTSSAAATITVGTSTNKPPTVTLTSPTNGTTYVAPATVTLTATASDTDGTISKVEFYNGTTLLNTDTTAPYSYSWSSVPGGTDNLRAVAYDNNGASASSATSTITVGSSSTPPTGVSFTASPDHATLVTKYELRIYLSTADINVAAPIAISNLGKPTPDATNTITVNQSSFLSSLSVGNYIAAVAAVGTGGSSLSTGVTFTR